MGLVDELDGVPTYTVSELGAELQGLLRDGLLMGNLAADAATSGDGTSQPPAARG